MIEIKNLTKIFKKPIRKEGIVGMFATLFSRKYEEITAVNDISLTIDDGEIIGYPLQSGTDIRQFIIADQIGTLRYPRRKTHLRHRPVRLLTDFQQIIRPFSSLFHHLIFLLQ